MAWAKELGEFVTIQFNGSEVVGKFGADGILDGKFSNGEAYTWKKRRRTQLAIDFAISNLLKVVVGNSLGHPDDAITG